MIMAYYLVRASLRAGLTEELWTRLDREEFHSIRPFGEALTYSLENARRDPQTGEAVWEEEDHCSPPSAMERAAVLDRYFDDLCVEPVREGEGWQRIAALPSLWGDRLAAAPDEPITQVLTRDEGQGPVCDWTTGQCDLPEWYTAIQLIVAELTERRANWRTLSRRKGLDFGPTGLYPGAGGAGCGSGRRSAPVAGTDSGSGRIGRRPRRQVGLDDGQPSQRLDKPDRLWYIFPKN